MLVLANKQDLPNAMPVHEMTEKLRLHAMKGRPVSKSDSNYESVIIFNCNADIFLKLK